MTGFVTFHPAHRVDYQRWLWIQLQVGTVDILNSSDIQLCASRRTQSTNEHRATDIHRRRIQFNSISLVQWLAFPWQPGKAVTRMSKTYGLCCSKRQSVLLSIPGDGYVMQSGAIIRPRGTLTLTLTLPYPTKLPWHYKQGCMATHKCYYPSLRRDNNTIC